MSVVNEGQSKRGKIILLSFENKRVIDFGQLENVASQLASFGFYCDRISRVAFDSSDEIVRAVKGGAANYENVFILCPSQMGKMLKQFVSELLNEQFDNFGVLKSGNIHVFLLFSDSENRLRFEDIKSILYKKYSIMYDSAVIKTVGAPAKDIEAALASAKELFEGDGIKFNVTDSYGDCRIQIVYSSQTPKMLLDEAVRTILKRLNEYVYAMEDIPLAEQLFRLLKLRRMKISVAESFTGGGVGKRLVAVSGVSEVFMESLNTYSNSSKMDRLGVTELTLAQRGAVSAETAYQMAEGLLKTGRCDVAISTTGIAGPKSDNTSKPVGLAYIGVGVDGEISVYKFNFVGDRQTITETAINRALFLAYKRLK
ncbi:MAG: nicotinamide-nucleotide amidohydrolase family protein [Clostridia bacterium]|nr:nicotinamide-nucleotide amidohydrolase family protein [Clostridia bacterium]